MAELYPKRHPVFKSANKLIPLIIKDRFQKIKDSNFAGEKKDLTEHKEITVTMIGHSTILIDFFGITILTDPVFYKTLGQIFKRKVKPGLSIKQLPKLDFVIISHAHLDHFNVFSLRHLAKKTRVLIIPENTKDLVKRVKFKNILETKWGDALKFGDFKITTFRPVHWGQRYPWERKKRGYNSYVFTYKGKNILFAGDSGYTNKFNKMSKKFPIHLALLPIGGYSPAIRKMHMNANDAVRVFREIKAKFFIPIHWGTFRLTAEPIDEPPKLVIKLMARHRLSHKLILLYPGNEFKTS
jgi:L-ascorbate metabolism protein UlaG (beta-lactamase superfamily)